MIVQRVLGQLIDLIYPPRCLLCSGIIPLTDKRWLCVTCRMKLVFTDSAVCSVCGKPRAETAMLCGYCSKIKHLFAKNRAVVIYDDNARYMIYRFKYGKKTEYARGLSTLMTSYAVDNRLVNGTEIVIPVPMHKDRQRSRGFNQAELLAKYLSADLRLEYSADVLVRIKNTKTQSALSPDERRKNMEDSMSVIGDMRHLIQNKTVLLVDDIFTTGSTADACAQVLLSSGAAEVVSFTFAVVFH